MRCGRDMSRVPDTDQRCQAIILDNSEEWVVVIEERSFPLHLRKWGFPKGKLKIGETHNQCVHREVCEEVGLQIPRIPHQYKEDVESKTKDKFVTRQIKLLLPHTKIPLVAGDEVVQARWMRISDLIDDVNENGTKKWNSLLRQSIHIIGGSEFSRKRRSRTRERRKPSRDESSWRRVKNTKPPTTPSKRDDTWTRVKRR